MLSNFALLILLTSYGVWSQLHGPDQQEHVVAKLVQDVEQLKAKVEQLEIKEKSLQQKFDDILDTECSKQKVRWGVFNMYIYTILINYV
jgi:hypothetical protein